MSGRIDLSSLCPSGLDLKANLPQNNSSEESQDFLRHIDVMLLIHINKSPHYTLNADLYRAYKQKRKTDPKNAKEGLFQAVVAGLRNRVDEG